MSSGAGIQTKVTLTKPSGTPRGQDEHPINLPAAKENCREALEMHRMNQPL